MLTKKKKYAKNPVELWRTTKLFNKEKKITQTRYDECIEAKTNANTGPLNPRACPMPTQTTITATLYRVTH